MDQTRSLACSLPVLRLLEPAHSSSGCLTQQPPEAGTVPAHSKLLVDAIWSSASPFTSGSRVLHSPTSALPQPHQGCHSSSTKKGWNTWIRHPGNSHHIPKLPRDGMETPQGFKGLVDLPCQMPAVVSSSSRAGPMSPGTAASPACSREPAEVLSQAVGASPRGHCPQLSLGKSFSFLS